MSDYSSVCVACKKRFPSGDPYSEMFCDDCGMRVFTACQNPKCGKAISSETAMYCRLCGSSFAKGRDEF